MADLTNHAFAQIDEDVDIFVCDRLKRANGEDLLPSDVLSWSLYVYRAGDAKPGSEVYQLLNQPPTSPPFFSALNGADGYSSKPYNFRHQIPGTAWDQIGGARYLILYRISTHPGTWGIIPLNRTIQIVASPL